MGERKLKFKVKKPEEEEEAKPAKEAAPATGAPAVSAPGGVRLVFENATINIERVVIRKEEE